MIEQGPPLSPEARTILDRERPIPSLPPAVRARAVAAARVALAVPAPAAPAPLPTPWMRWAVAAAVTVAAGGAAAAVGYRRHVDHLRTAEAARPSRQGPLEHAPPALPAAPSPPAASPSPSPLPSAATARPSSPPASEDARRAKAGVPQAELGLLRRARAAVARDDFAAALPPIAEHARRFRDGRLAEEREALRVKALAGLGREDEAQRAAAAFEVRFPHSVLLPAVMRTSPRGE